jgi:copper transport protein
VALRQGLTLYGGLVACGSFLLWGHTRGAEPVVLAGAADLVHVTVAAVWLGGLVGLGLTLAWRGRGIPATTTDDTPRDGGPVTVATAARPVSSDPVPASATAVTGTAVTTAEDDPARRHGDPDDVHLAGPTTRDALDSAGVVLRFSNVAGYALVALWVSGVAMAWTLADLPDDLTATTWGRWLLAKTALVVVVALLGLWNRRRLVPTLLAAAETAEPGDAVGEDAVRAHSAWAALRRSVRWEAGLLVVVVLLTGALVDTPPGVGSGGGGVYQATVPVDDRLHVELLVSPAIAGRNSVHVTYVDELGRPADQPVGATLRASLVDPAVGPVEIETSKGGPGHYITATDVLSVPGTWELELVTRIDEFTAERTAFRVPVAAP